MLRRVKNSKEVDFQFQQIDIQDIAIQLSEEDKVKYNSKIEHFE